MNLEQYDYVCFAETLNGQLGTKAFRTLVDLRKMTVLRYMKPIGWERLVLEYGTEGLTITERELLNVSEEMDLYLRLKYL